LGVLQKIAMPPHFKNKFIFIYIQDRRVLKKKFFARLKFLTG